MRLKISSLETKAKESFYRLRMAFVEYLGQPSNKVSSAYNYDFGKNYVESSLIYDPERKEWH